MGKLGCGAWGGETCLLRCGERLLEDRIAKPQPRLLKGFLTPPLHGHVELIEHDYVRPQQVLRVV